MLALLSGICHHDWRLKRHEVFCVRSKLIVAGLQFTKDKATVTVSFHCGNVYSVLSYLYHCARNRSTSRIDELSAYATNWFKWTHLIANHFSLCE